jgi:hypothetical protein
MEKVEPKEKIECAVCGEKFPIITPSHLMRKHNMSLSIYKEKFPDAPISSAQYKARQKFLKGNLFVKEKQDPIIDEVDLNKLTLESEMKVDTEIEDIKISSSIQERKLFKDIIDKKKEEGELVVTQIEIKKSVPQRQAERQIPADKLRIIEFLKTVFPASSVVNNFMIEKFYHEGLLQYQFITDIAIPSKKIDIEFTKSFWHNFHVPDVYRNHKLERDGWTIIEIQELSPSVDEVKSYLKHRRLI